MGHIDETLAKQQQQKLATHDARLHPFGTVAGHCQALGLR
jgi:hypothetical protein